MGAGNSTPQTERIDNPTRMVPVHVSPSVVTRLEAEQKLQNDVKSQQQEDPSQKPPTSPEMFYKTYVDLEQTQFDREFEKLENLVDTPVLWLKDIDEEIKVLRRDLIECYRDYPGETLYCADLAKKYQDFIFREQYKSILKLSEERGKATPATPPEPHQHSPPYT